MNKTTFLKAVIIGLGTVSFCAHALMVLNKTELNQPLQAQLMRDEYWNWGLQSTVTKVATLQADAQQELEFYFSGPPGLMTFHRWEEEDYYLYITDENGKWLGNIVIKQDFLSTDTLIISGNKGSFTVEVMSQQNEKLS